MEDASLEVEGGECFLEGTKRLSEPLKTNSTTKHHSVSEASFKPFISITFEEFWNSVASFGTVGTSGNPSGITLPGGSPPQHTSTKGPSRFYSSI